MKRTILISLMLTIFAIESPALYYGKPITGGILIVNGETPFPAGAIFPVPLSLRTMPARYLKIVDGKIVEKTLAEKTAADLPAKQAADEAAARAAKESFEAQLTMSKVTPETLKGMLDALIEQINKNEAFVSKPIDVKIVEAELSAAISNRITAVAAEPIALGMMLKRTKTLDTKSVTTGAVAGGTTSLVLTLLGWLLQKYFSKKSKV